MVAAIGNAAKRGILIKSGEIVEQVGKVDVVAFDKTGTLTIGKPVVSDVIAVDSVSADQVLAYAAAAEKFSEHPIGRALVTAGNKHLYNIGEPTDFNPLPGYGISAQVDGRRVTIGNRTLLTERGISWNVELEEQASTLELQREHCYTSRVGQWGGRFGQPG